MDSDPGRQEHVKIAGEIVKSWMTIASNIWQIPPPLVDDWFEEMCDSLASRQVFLDPKPVILATKPPEDWLDSKMALVSHQLFYALLSQASPEIVQRFIDKVVENTYDDRSCHDCAGDIRILLALVKVPAGRIARKQNSKQRKMVARGREIYSIREFAIA